MNNPTAKPFDTSWLTPRERKSYETGMEIVARKLGQPPAPLPAAPQFDASKLRPQERRSFERGMKIIRHREASAILKRMDLLPLSVPPPRPRKLTMHRFCTNYGGLFG